MRYRKSIRNCVCPKVPSICSDWAFSN